MKLKILAIGLLLIVATLSGCIGKDAMTTDTYRCVVDDGVLYLSSDYQYRMLIDEMHGGGGIYGNFTSIDGLILLERSFLGDLIPFSIDGRDLIDPDGDRWVRD